MVEHGKVDKSRRKKGVGKKPSGLRRAYVRRDAIDLSLDAKIVQEAAKDSGLRIGVARSLLKEKYESDRDNRWVIESSIGKHRSYFDVRDGVYTSELQHATAFHTVVLANAVNRSLGGDNNLVEVRLLRSGRLVLNSSQNTESSTAS